MIRAKVAPSYSLVLRRWKSHLVSRSNAAASATNSFNSARSGIDKSSSLTSSSSSLSALQLQKSHPGERCSGTVSPSVSSFSSMASSLESSAASATSELPVKPIPSPGPPKNKLAGLFLGHLADLRPWDSSESVASRLAKQIPVWYDESKSDFFEVNFAGSRFAFTRDVDVVREVIWKQQSNFMVDDKVKNVFGTLFPTSIIVLEGEDWKRRRSIFMKAINRLQFDNLPRMTSDICVKAAGVFMKGAEQDVRLRNFFTRVTFDSLHLFTFGHDFNVIGGENERILSDAYLIARTIRERFVLPFQFLAKIPTKANRDANAALQRLFQIADGFVEERERTYHEQVAKGEVVPFKTKAQTLLDAFLFASFESMYDNQNPEANDEENSAMKVKRPTMTREELREEVTGSIFAAFETTNSTTSLILSLLVDRPDIQERLFEEIKDVDLSQATQEKMESLQLLNNVILESNRIRPLASAPVRQAKEDSIVKGYFIKKGTSIGLDHENLGLVPGLWENAKDLHEFNPDRWINFKPPKGAYLPFGIGARSCAGKRIAESQLQVILSFLVQNFKIKPAKKPVQLSNLLGRCVTPESELKFVRR